MAVTYQSIASSAWANNASTTISKPSGTADGDLLIAFLAGARNGGTNPSMSSAPSGWTEIHNTTVDSSTGRMISYYKVASSEPASWTWTWNSANPDTTGTVLRIAGGSASLIQSDDGSVGSSASPTFAGGVTPAQTNTLLIFAAFSKDAGTAHSSHAVVSSNPSWTERRDNASALGTSGIISVATATRPEDTATGNFSITIDGGSSSSDSIGHLLSIGESVSVQVDVGALEVASTMPSATVSGSANVSVAALSGAMTMPTATVTTQENSVWTFEDLPSDDVWIIEEI